MTARAALIPFLARIPVRVSPASKIYLFLSTMRIRQKQRRTIYGPPELYNNAHGKILIYKSTQKSPKKGQKTIDKYQLLHYNILI